MIVKVVDTTSFFSQFFDIMIIYYFTNVPLRDPIKIVLKKSTRKALSNKNLKKKHKDQRNLGSPLGAMFANILRGQSIPIEAVC